VGGGNKVAWRAKIIQALLFIKILQTPIGSLFEGRLVIVPVEQTIICGRPFLS
jgi:hypothetical protein